MLHHNRDEFLAHLERSAAQTAFPLRLMEKDYYLTIVLDRIHMLSDDLVFKGGTCLNKIYFSYYRLSEDLDFTLKLPEENITRVSRRNPFTGEPLFKTGTVSCLPLVELVAEKTRAAISRLHCAPRDFYDLKYALEAGFDFRDENFLEVLKIKLKEDGFSEDLSR